MKAVVYCDPLSVEIRDVPAPDGDGVLLDVQACGICGTDLSIYKGVHPRSKAPLILGHEFVAFVAEDRDGFAQGERVICFPLLSCGTCDTCRSGQAHICETLRLYGIDVPGGMAEQVRIPATGLIRIDNDIPAAVAAQAEPLAVCVHAAKRARITPTDTVAIIGAGPIGTTLAAYLRHIGLTSVKLFDTNMARIETLTKGGFDAAPASSESYARYLHSIQKNGFDVVFECAGAEPSVTDAVTHVRVGGRVAIVSIHKGALPVDLQRIAFREIELIGTRVYTRADFEDAAGMLNSMRECLTWIAGDMYTLIDVPDMFIRLIQGSSPLKAVISVSR